jgi:hypothetical protein
MCTRCRGSSWTALYGPRTKTESEAFMVKLTVKQLLVERRAARLILLAVAATVGPGCKDQAKCDEAIGNTRKAIQIENTASARQWREYAWKACGGTDTAKGLDTEILAKETEIVQRADAEAKAAQALAQTRMAEAQAAYKAFDALEEKERTAKALRKVSKDVNRLRGGLLQEYAKQIEDYNQAALEKREAKLDEKK